MICSRKILPLVFGALLGFIALSAAAQKMNSEGSSAQQDAAKKDKDSPELEFPKPSEETYTPRKYSRSEVMRLCAKVQGQVIAYYSEFWKVVDCEKRPIVDSKTIYEHLRAGGRVVDADEDTVAALPEGDPLDWAITKQAARSCRQLEGQYVTYSAVDVYFVEKCKKRIFPDWATYLKHREQHSDKKGEILSLSLLEFEQLELGEEVPSIVDEIFAKLLRGDAGVEVIPIDEACRGVDGRIVSYYSRLYRIERCRKREINDPEEFLRRLSANDKNSILELRSEQWLSLPDGAPINIMSKRETEPASRSMR